MLFNLLKGEPEGRIIEATAHLRVSEDSACVEIQGDWLAEKARTNIAMLRRGLSCDIKNLSFDCSKLGDFDSALICLLLRLHDKCRELGINVDLSGLPDGPRRLLELAVAVPEKPSDKSEKPSGLFYQMGNRTINMVGSFKDQLEFFGDMIIATGRLFIRKARFSTSDLMLQIQRAGPEALPIVGLISFLVGLILAFVSAIQLAKYATEIFVADLVGLAMVREMGAVMVAIVMAGRTGASYAAELGSMKINEEIAAFKTFGISPLEFLVLPRMIALILMFPLLTIFSDFIGMLGGFAIGWGMFDINYDAYMGRTIASLDLVQCATGVGKSLVFGVIVATVGCMKGITCGNSSAAVGMSTTSSVVTSITLIIVADAIFAILFNIFGI